jgi:AraC-like DNA-binding protein
MEYGDTLRLLHDVLTKMLIRVRTASLSASAEQLIDRALALLADHVYKKNACLEEYFGHPEPKTLYNVTDPFGLSYLYMLLPENNGETVLVIGPFATEIKTTQALLEIEERLGIPPKLHKLFFDYITSVPVLPSPQYLLVTVEAFAEKIWSSPITILDKNRENETPVSPINTPGTGDMPDNTLIDMSIMERRYQFENEMMQAVSSGQISKADLILGSFSDETFEKRLPDSLRNFKNYCIIMNTLLRKAAEKGGVHPMYLDSLSSSFAVRIEALTSHTDHFEFMLEMFRAYCRLVRKHTMQGFSPIVRKAVLMIDADLSANLSLATLAEAQNVSSGYLATIFKKETDKTVSEYIREKRVGQAKHLLSTTNLQVQTIALHCGIMDVQYFTKLFKKETGKTPKEYREYTKNNQNL